MAFAALALAAVEALRERTDGVRSALTCSRGQLPGGSIST